MKTIKITLTEEKYHSLMHDLYHRFGELYPVAVRGDESAYSVMEEIMFLIFQFENRNLDYDEMKEIMSNDLRKLA